MSIESIMMMQQFGAGATCIPGVSMIDVFTAGLRDAGPLRDPQLQRRVQHWKAMSVAELKTECSAARCSVTGNKTVLALRLALKSLPAEVPVATPAPASKAAGKRKASDGSQPKTKASKPAAKPSNELACLKSSKAALAKADANELALIKTADLKKSLNAHVQSLARTVDADWHDSYEETAEEACEWFGQAGAAVEACMSVAAQGVALDQCHEALKLVADTWANIQAIPFRCDVSEDVSNVDTSIDVDLGGEEPVSFGLFRPEGLLALAWPVLLARAASDATVPDGALLRMIKDAVDHGVGSPHLPSDEEKELQSEHGEDIVGGDVTTGRARLATLFSSRKAEWSGLASTKKHHKMRRAIDRRFDGPKHLRTRDFGDDSDDGYGYGGFGGGYGGFGGGYGYGDDSDDGYGSY